jgi:hypothetical protein
LQAIPFPTASNSSSGFDKILYTSSILSLLVLVPLLDQLDDLEAVLQGLGVVSVGLEILESCTCRTI